MARGHRSCTFEKRRVRVTVHRARRGDRFAVDEAQVLLQAGGRGPFRPGDAGYRVPLATEPRKHLAPTGEETILVRTFDQRELTPLDAQHAGEQVLSAVSDQTDAAEPLPPGPCRRSFEDLEPREERRQRGTFPSPGFAQKRYSSSPSSLAMRSQERPSSKYRKPRVQGAAMPASECEYSRACQGHSGELDGRAAAHGNGAHEQSRREAEALRSAQSENPSRAVARANRYSRSASTLTPPLPRVSFRNPVHAADAPQVRSCRRHACAPPCPLDDRPLQRQPRRQLGRACRARAGGTRALRAPSTSGRPRA